VTIVFIRDHELPHCCVQAQGVLVWFTAFSNHGRCSLLPAVIETFKDERKGLSTFKGAIPFPTDKPRPTALEKKLVKA
jgi:uncharacterized protein YdhG (YjbR/CyaY superfamily)